MSGLDRFGRTTPLPSKSHAAAAVGVAVGDPTRDLVADAAHGWWTYPLVQETAEYIFTGFAADRAGGAHGIARIHKETGIVERRLIAFIDQEDDHNVPALLIQPDGTMLAAYCGHAIENKIYIARTAGRNSLDIAHTVVLTTGDTQCSYAQLLSPTAGTRAGNVFLFYRTGSSADGQWCGRYSADNGRTWSAEQELFATQYCVFTYELGAVGDRFRVFMYPGTTPDVSPHDVKYALLSTSGTGEVRLPGTGAIANTAWLGGSVTALPLAPASLYNAVTIGSDFATRDVRIFDSRRMDLNTSSSAGGNPSGNVVGLETILAVEFPNPGGALTTGALYRYLYQGSGTPFERKLVLANVGEPFFGSYYNGACFGHTSIDTVYAIRNPSNKNATHELVELRTTNAGNTWTERVVLTSPYRIARPTMLSDGRIMITEFVAPYNNWDDWTSNGIRIITP